MLEEMTVKELSQIIGLLNAAPKQTNPAVGKFCIVRCHNAGVHAGVVESADGSFVVLRNSRRMWKWFSGFTLSEAANNGIDKSKSRIAETVDSLVLITNDIAEMIPCTAEARKTIEEA